MIDIAYYKKHYILDDICGSPPDKPPVPIRGSLGGPYVQCTLRTRRSEGKGYPTKLNIHIYSVTWTESPDTIWASATSEGCTPQSCMASRGGGEFEWLVSKDVLSLTPLQQERVNHDAISSTHFILKNDSQLYAGASDGPMV